MALTWKIHAPIILIFVEYELKGEEVFVVSNIGESIG